MEIGKHSLEEKGEKEKCELGLHTITHGFEKEIDESIMKIVDTSLRSGKKVEYEGSVVILGDVNAGAEVIAENHIIILGTLRGLAHAGAKGNRKAIIAAGSIETTQIRIADIVKEIEKVKEEMPEEETKKGKKKDKKEKNIEIEEESLFEENKAKTRAYIKDNEIVIE